MNRDSIIKTVVFPLVLAVIIGVLAFVEINAGIGRYLPVSKDRNALAFESAELPSEQYSDKEAEPEKNALLGLIGDTDLRYDCDYTALMSSASVSPKGAMPYENGCTYIKVSPDKALLFGTTLEITDAFGSYSYKLSKEQTVRSENAALSLAPKGRKTLVVYYSESEGAGITSGYNVLIYKEVG